MLTFIQTCHTTDLILEDFLGNNASKHLFFPDHDTLDIRDNGQIVSISAKVLFLISIHVLEPAIAVNPKWCGPCREMQTVAPLLPHKIMLRGEGGEGGEGGPCRLLKLRQ
jgi:hypothetical protein